MVAAGPGVDHCEAAVQQERLLSHTLEPKQSQGATAQGVAGEPQRLARFVVRTVHCK